MYKQFRFDPQKAIEVISYIASKAPVPDVYHICKILYFADKAHLERFGRLVCGDQYIAMKNGPVPSGIYDILKDVRDCRVNSAYYVFAKAAFAVANSTGNHMVTPLRDANVDALSDSDLQSIDQSIKEYGTKSFQELKRISHDAAWDSADEDDYIDLDAIIGTLKDAEYLREHLRNPFPG